MFTLYRHIKNSFVYIFLGTQSKQPTRKIPTNAVDVCDLHEALSIIQPETIVVANIWSKKHPVARIGKNTRSLNMQV